MNKRILVPICIVFGLLLVACGTVTVNKNDSTPPATKTEPALPPATTAGTSGERVGVPECDEFITAYDACILSKVPDADRAKYKAGVEQWRSSWRKLAENPNTKAMLVAACKQAAEEARKSMNSYNCTF